MSGRKLFAAFGILLLLAAGAAGGWYWWTLTEKDRIIEENKRVIASLEAKLDRVWAKDVVADVRVDGLSVNAASGQPEMRLTFIMYEPGTEKPVMTRPMVLLGSEFYIDALVVKFDRKLVEEGEGLRGKSLLLFRRAFGDLMQPVQGVPLYRSTGESMIPEALQVDAAPSPFEEEIWRRFWEYANDPKAAAAAGVAVAQGEAPHVKPVLGQVYKITLHVAGGLDIVPRLPAAVLPGGGVGATGTAPGPILTAAPAPAGSVAPVGSGAAPVH
ncbi:MAG TPA: hypothetical protein VG389_23090 [Myxococcota bacterium]|jgi:hypothetical protein|nr:hypothetical protein [Myxococcota bacterium]